MKTLKAKFNWVLSVLMSLILITTFSCNEENEVQENQEIVESENLNEEELIGSESPIIQGRLQKQFEVKLEEAHYLILLSTNNEEIFKTLDEKSVTSELISSVELDKQENTENIDSSVKEGNENSAYKNSEEHFIAIHIKEIKQSDDKNLKVTLSDNLIGVLKKFKAQTIITNEQNNDETKAFTLNTNGFVAYGDGGRIPTKLKIYYRYSKFGRIFPSTTRNGFYNNFTFRTCEWPTTSSTRCRYTTFKVTQDVLKSFIAFNTYKCKKC